MVDPQRDPVADGTVADGTVESLTEWDADPASAARSTRRELGRLLGADLACCGLQPQLLRLLVHGEPVARALITAGTDAEDDSNAVGLRDETLMTALRAGLLDEFDVDGEPYLRALACVLPDRLSDGDLAWIACDLPWAAGRADHVPGPDNASRTLLHALAVREATRAADVGTGCGVIALHLSTFAEQVVATDVNPRALAFAELTAALNGRRWDLRLGSFLEPIAAEPPDLIVANPPFVIGNPDEAAVFRDGNASLAASLAGDVAVVLRPGGTAQFLGNWVYAGDQDVTADVIDAARDVDCLVIERAVVPPADYVALWTDDADLQSRWIANLHAMGADAIGTGIVTLHRRSPAGADRRTGVARLYDEDDEPLGAAIADWLAGE